MKYVSFLLLVGLLASCGMKIPYTNELKTKYYFKESNYKKIKNALSQIGVLT